MKRFKIALNFMNKNSLLAFDEPCVSTSAEDGICLAVSVCVKILDSKAFAFCVTHHHYLTRISETFLNSIK